MNCSFTPSYIPSTPSEYYSSIDNLDILFNNMDRAVKAGYKKLEIPYLFVYAIELHNLGYRFKTRIKDFKWTMIIVL